MNFLKFIGRGQHCYIIRPFNELWYDNVSYSGTWKAYGLTLCNELIL